MSLDLYVKAITETTVFDWNITHNLTKMAAEAGLYDVMWHPENITPNKCRDLIPILEEGIALLKGDPERFKKFNPPNGWGNYEGLLEAAERYLAACREYPDGWVVAHR